MRIFEFVNRRKLLIIHENDCHLFHYTNAKNKKKVKQIIQTNLKLKYSVVFISSGINSISFKIIGNYSTRNFHLLILLQDYIYAFNGIYYIFHKCQDKNHYILTSYINLNEDIT